MRQTDRQTDKPPTWATGEKYSELYVSITHQAAINTSCYAGVNGKDEEEEG